MASLFISDLHLDPSRPAISRLFLQFLREQAADAQALYILGDLFEAWVGDDEDSELAQVVRAALRELQACGVPVFIMRGNRDFLLGRDFAADTGARLLPDPCVISLYGEPTLVLHGDLLCTDDHAYLAVRQQVREPAWQEQFLGQSLPARRAFAEQARSQSQHHQAALRETGALEAITDANAQTVENMMTQFGVTRLIHGHTHRPAIHAHRSGDRPAQRVVLGDWYEQGSVLAVDSDGLVLSTLSVDA